MQPLYRNRLIKLIKNARDEYIEAQSLDHRGLQGRVREIALQNIVAPLLPPAVAAGTGVIVARDGDPTPQLDIVIYDRSILPPIMFDPTFGVFPLEASLFTIEVKSTLRAGDVRQASASARAVDGLWDKMLPGKFEPNGEYKRGADGKLIPIVPCKAHVFAFESDLTGQDKDELARYRENDPRANTDPAVRSICVMGRGFWMFDERVQKWKFDEPTDEFDEVIAFVYLLLNSISFAAESRGHPRVGYYFGRNDHGNVVV